MEDLIAEIIKEFTGGVYKTSFTRADVLILMDRLAKELSYDES